MRRFRNGARVTPFSSPRTPLGAPTFTYTVQFEDLASHGFRVAAIDHTSDTPLVVFPDGRAVPISQQWDELMTLHLSHVFL